jgi:hypothetical protein
MKKSAAERWFGAMSIFFGAEEVYKWYCNYRIRGGWSERGRLVGSLSSVGSTSLRGGRRYESRTYMARNRPIGRSVAGESS